MKKILFSIFAICTLQLSAQKTINIFNNTKYNLHNALMGADQTNSNCYPSLFGVSNTPVPSGGAVSYTGYYNNSPNPSIPTWSVTLAVNNVSNMPTNSPVLTPLGMATDWMMNKFFLSDPNGATIPYNNETIGTIGCGLPIITEIHPTPSIPYPFNAFWFVVGGQTYFNIEDK
ncbi:hypothetical protein BBI01_04425 [Chryseobacterium artocarpi]|uniref:Uncharacterized protein n=1 Tax=Chryseobacterium artocarpi TaxID=1414727 RepID=A0A1B8ZWJ3_9FLAO|nr:hypothetical protein [Chryseobacterium artocarpi]OCA75949.1 hypothetical protein BBI01_04425 [Chryseobacterium artocarpi]